MAVDEIGHRAPQMGFFSGVLNQNKHEFAYAIAVERRPSSLHAFGVPLRIDETSITRRWPENSAEGSIPSMPATR